jgi:hypothetical protein
MTKKRIMASISARRKCVSLLLSVPLVFTAWAQVWPQGPAKAVARKEPPLRYRIIASKPSVCLAQGLNLELELENTSAHKVTIDRHGLFYQVGLSGVSFSGEGRVKSWTGDDMKKPLPDQFVTLEPGQSYRKTVPYDLKSFDSSPGVYRIQATYGQFMHASPAVPDLFRGTVDSNEILFEVLDCDSDSQ